MRNRTVLICCVALMACLMAELTACHKQKAAPSIDGLSAALQRSADKTIPAPSLATEQMVITGTAGKTGEQADMVEKVAEDAGGVAIRSVDDTGRISILATIPRNNAGAFKSSLQNQKQTMQKPSPESELIEVLIEIPAASPTP